MVMSDYNEDLITFSDSGDSEVVVEIPQEVRKITTQAYDKSVSDIVRMIEEKDIILDPDFQRNYIWDNKKASMLIESIILNVPIPVVYVSQEKDDTWVVIDGLQRLWSLKRFFDGKFKLSGLEILTELNKQDIHTLNSKALRMLRNGLLRVIMITHDSNEDIKYDVFMRLNTGSVHLNEQELRNCLYRGPLNSLLKDLANNSNWLSLLGLKSAHQRMSDREMILRFLAIYTNWDSSENIVKGYKGRMKTFLNTFMHTYRNIEKHQVEEWRTLFQNTVEKVINIFADSAFRKLSVDADKERSINRAIMDILMVSLTRYENDILCTKKEVIREQFYLLLSNNQDFRNSILMGTSDTKALNYRMAIWNETLANIIVLN